MLRVDAGVMHDDRRVIVTGGSRGIGLAVAESLLTQGARVCITARGDDGLASAAQQLNARGRLLVVAGKAHDDVHRAEVFDKVVSTWGGVDALVANAGINPVQAALLDTDALTIQKVLQVNAIAALDWARSFASAPGRDRRSIVSISSFAALIPSPGLGIYGVSKAALLHVTRQLALELAPAIRVNAVAPAVITTDFSAVFYRGHESEIAARYPLGRLGTSNDVAAAVSYLVSDQAAWVTGQTLTIDGGLSLTGGVS
jgi:NAD(P)-dependent dehydrogenase (short-subunit alcohol dehydrogenase family)